MKLIVILCIFLPSIYFSQDIRFTYSYKFVVDTLKKDAITDEIVVLDISNNDKKSVFTSLKHIISDSVMTEKSKKGITSFPDTSTKVRYVVEKIHKENSVYFYTPDHMIDPVLKVKDDRNLNWKITNDQENIHGYKAQKATAFFAGRYWTAWYTNEIPISDGPYKFRGLPGLILRISDQTQTHSFEILSVKKQNRDYFILNDTAYIEARQTSSDIYENMIEEERKNPLAKFRNKAFNGEMYFHNDEEKQRFLKDIDAQIKERKIHDNNPIELNNL